MFKLAIASLSLLTLASSAIQAAEMDVFIGTGGRGAKGIYHATFNTESGKLGEVKLAAELSWSGFLALHPNNKVLYAVSSREKKPVVVAYKIGKDSKLSLLNTSKMSDGHASHIAVHPSGKFLMTAQYGGGSVGVFPLEADGKLKEESQLIEHTGGSKVVEKRQNEPHPHWVGFSPDGRFAFVPDLGTDQIWVYKVTGNRIEYSSKANSIPGGGPRHMRFSVDGKFVYLLNELTMSVTTFAYDKTTGILERRSTSAALDQKTIDSEGFNAASEIVVHPNGKFIYSGNRGNDSISVFNANRMTGKLKRVEIEPVRGSWPRNINIDPKGQWIIAAGLHTHSLSVFKIDQDSGKLQFQVRNIKSVPSPQCILFRK